MLRIVALGNEPVLVAHFLLLSYYYYYSIILLLTRDVCYSYFFIFGHIYFFTALNFYTILTLFITWQFSLICVFSVGEFRGLLWLGSTFATGAAHKRKGRRGCQEKEYANKYMRNLHLTVYYQLTFTSTKPPPAPGCTLREITGTGV